MRKSHVVVAVVLFTVVAAACGGGPAQPARATSAPSRAATAMSAPSPEATAESVPPSLEATATSAPSPEATAESEPSPEATAEGEPPPTVRVEKEPSPAPITGTAKLFEDFDPNTFSRSIPVDNPWLPLKPGTRLTYEGNTVEDDGTVVPHRVVINVTDLTKVIAGVRSAVTWDLDYSDDTLVEAELAFYAQDDDGRVWRMGEYPEAYENGEFVEAPTWIHGLEEARAGIMMQANPRTGTTSYAQGWAPAVDWTDRGRVDQVGQKTCVPVACYDDVLVIAETSQAEPDAQQLKYYARDVGNVRIGWRGAREKTKESLEMVKIEQLSEEELAEVRAEALKLEEHAYEVSPEVYGQTPPAEPMPAAADQ